MRQFKDRWRAFLQAVVLFSLSSGCSAPRGDCPQGQVLIGTNCRMVAPDASVMTCPVGQLSCGGLCFDSRTDESNCGGCGVRCASNQVCINAVCEASSACDVPRRLCAGSCIDVTNDQRNCGDCGRQCPGGTICSSGTCACNAGTTMCSAGCVDLQTSGSNCGVCGRACVGDQLCSGGSCVLSCGAGFTNCGGGCRNTATDPTNCGACGRACAVGQLCVAGSCQVDCSRYNNCSSCGAITGCGWCGSTRSCVRTNSTCTGPASGSCPGNWSCAPGDCARHARPCASDADCDPTGSPISSRCVNVVGNGPGATCSIVCRSNDDCDSGCCGSVNGQTYRVCIHAAACISRTACFVQANSASVSCTDTSECCRWNDGSGRPSLTQCDYSYTTPICARLCSRNSDCSTGCCSFDSGADIWRCASPGSGRTCSPI